MLNSFFNDSDASAAIWESIRKENYCNESNFGIICGNSNTTQGAQQFLVYNEVYNSNKLMQIPLPGARQIIIPKGLIGDEIPYQNYHEYIRKISESLPKYEKFISALLNNEANLEKILSLSYYEQKNSVKGKVTKSSSKPEVAFMNLPELYYDSYSSDEPIETKPLFMNVGNLIEFMFFQLDKKYFYDIYNVLFDKEMYRNASISNQVPNIWLFISNLILKEIILFNEIPDDEKTLADKLFAMKNKEESQKSYHEVKKNFKKVFGNELDFDVFEVTSSEDNNKIIKIEDKNKNFKLSDSASGYFDVLSLFTEISNKKSSVVILDEPLTRLHHSKQRLVGNELSRNENGNQIIMVTHSSSFVNYGIILNNNLIYVKRDGDNSKIYQGVPINKDNIPKSHLLNPDIFFSGYVLAVEGATDEAVFKAMSDFSNDLFWKYDILIWNMNGKDNSYKFGNLMYKYGINFIILADHDFNKKGYAQKHNIKAGVFHCFPFEDNKSDKTKSIYIMNDDDINMDCFLEKLGYKGGAERYRRLLRFCIRYYR
ncbi:MAG: ATP-dependent nuclease [bacterium]